MGKGGKMEIKKEDREKLILGIQAAVGAAYLLLALKNSAKGKTPQMKKVMAKQAKRLDKLNRLEYKQEKKVIKRRGKMEAAAERRNSGRKLSILRQKF